MLNYTLNDQPRQIAPNTNISTLLKTHLRAGQPCAVAINQAIVPCHCFDSTLIQAGDKVDIVTPLQGG